MRLRKDHTVAMLAGYCIGKHEIARARRRVGQIRDIRNGSFASFCRSAHDFRSSPGADIVMAGRHVCKVPYSGNDVCRRKAYSPCRAVDELRSERIEVAVHVGVRSR
jgi:hypothetical protein